MKYKIKFVKKKPKTFNVVVLCGQVHTIVGEVFRMSNNRYNGNTPRIISNHYMKNAWFYHRSRTEIREAVLFALLNSNEAYL